MQALEGTRVAGFEANGEFLLGFDAGPLPALPTRDAVLPLIAPLVAARAMDVSLSVLVARLPTRVTRADRLQGIDRTRAEAWISALARDATARATLWDGKDVTLDLTDGVRMIDARGDILHLRLSGNAPELRVYVDAGDTGAAQDLLDRGLAHARTWTGASTDPS
ncbi:hypothetical protein EU805_15625 [Salipiger sp. IMCC34102]|uniref:hypothetical protein n=1 Tax=Salipiger sp. IMCC34102 TaxID=2510647 RepID=UPI00101B719D|nr:hypothetical protein EU805_15625 [Salipiger sp. IMCC34102]